MDVQTEVWGTYKFVFWAIDDHRELDKAHRRKPALEVNRNPCIGTAADFGMSELAPQIAESSAKEQDSVYLFKQGKSGTSQSLYRPLGYGYYLTLKYVKVADQKNDLAQGYYSGIWYKPFQNTPEKPLKKKQIDRPADWVRYALGWDSQGGYLGYSRVNILSWGVHGLNFGEIVMFANNTFITADEIANSGLNLKNLRWAILLNCTEDNLQNSTSEESWRMFTAFKLKGTQFVGGIRGGPIFTNEALTFAQNFWKLTTKGKVIGDSYYLVPLYTAIKEAFSATYPYIPPDEGGPVLRRGSATGTEILGGWVEAVNLGSQDLLLY
jgi:hypothetical protein